VSVEDYPVSFSLEVNVEPAYEDIRKVQTAVHRTLGLLRQMGVTSLDDFITKGQRAIQIANQARLAIAALQATSGPIGWALFGIGLVSTWVSTVDFIDDLDNELKGRE